MGGVVDGTLDIVTTDHSPFVPADKEAGWTDIWKALPGFPGVEILTGFVIGAALAGQLDLVRASALIAAEPARIFGLAPAKGAIPRVPMPTLPSTTQAARPSWRQNGG